MSEEIRANKASLDIDGGVVVLPLATYNDLLKQIKDSPRLEWRNKELYMVLPGLTADVLSISQGQTISEDEQLVRLVHEDEIVVASISETWAAYVRRTEAEKAAKKTKEEQGNV